jgi:hypothetical protein
MSTNIWPIFVVGVNNFPTRNFDELLQKLLQILSFVQSEGSLACDRRRGRARNAGPGRPRSSDTGALVNAQPADDLRAAAGQAALDGSRLASSSPRPSCCATSRTAPVIEHSPRRSIAIRSNGAVNCEPGSAHGTRSCLTPWLAHSTQGTSASIQVVNCIVSSWRHRRALAVITASRRAALRTRVRPRPGLHPHHHALLRHVHVHGGHCPSGRQPQQCSVQLHVAHGSDPSRSERGCSGAIPHNLR